MVAGGTLRPRPPLSSDRRSVTFKIPETPPSHPRQPFPCREVLWNSCTANRAPPSCPFTEREIKAPERQGELERGIRAGRGAGRERTATLLPTRALPLTSRKRAEPRSLCFSLWKSHGQPGSCRRDWPSPCGPGGEEQRGSGKTAWPRGSAQARGLVACGMCRALEVLLSQEAEGRPGPVLCLPHRF